MEWFDCNLWSTYYGHYIIIFMILLFVLLLMVREQGKEARGNSCNRPSVDGNGSIYYRARGHRSESIETLLDRTEWATYLSYRASIWQRLLISSIIATGLVILLVYRGFPLPGDIIMLLVVIFLSFYTCHKFMYTHGDIYNDFYIKNNVNIIRRKLDLPPRKRSKPPKPINNRISHIMFVT